MQAGANICNILYVIFFFPLTRKIQQVWGNAHAVHISVPACALPSGRAKPQDWRLSGQRLFGVGSGCPSGPLPSIAHSKMNIAICRHANEPHAQLVLKTSEI